MVGVVRGAGGLNGWLGLRFLWREIRVGCMSTKAQAILDEIRALPPAELQVVCSEIRRLETRRQGWEEQMAKLREMQARHAGSGLLSRLLEERAKERARG